MISKPIEVKPLGKHKIFIRFEDGKEGAIDLSHLAGKGVFVAWDKNDLFNKVYIDNETLAIAWNKTLELSPDALYLKLVGKSFEEWNADHHATTQ